MFDVYVYENRKVTMRGEEEILRQSDNGIHVTWMQRRDSGEPARGPIRGSRSKGGEWPRDMHKKV